MDFLWHKVSEEEQESIKREAKAIMDDFAKSLKGLDRIEFGGVQRELQLRKETAAGCSLDFRKRFFDNVPNRDGDWLKAEKKRWK